MNKKIVIIGAGLTGTYIGRNLAEQGYKVTIYDKRNHVAGNIYDYKDKNTNNIVHKYGPHIFHSDDTKTWNWLNRFSEWDKTSHRSRVLFKDTNKWHTMSFGLHTIKEIYDEGKANKIINELLTVYSDRVNSEKFEDKRVTILELLNSKNELIKELGEFLWENDFKPYTSKQWGISPDDVDKNIFYRVPFHLTNHNKLFNNKYEAFPRGGYTKIIENALAHENITVKLNNNPMDSISIRDNKVYMDNEEIILIFTGAIDELFDYKYGELGYRSLTFEFFENDFDGKYEDGRPNVDIYPTINKNNEIVKYTRISNYGLFHYNNGENSKTKQISAKEYSHKFERNTNLDRYYPLSTDFDKEIYSKYKKDADVINGLYLAGRLADYKYYDMDKALITADEKLSIILGDLNE